MAAPERPGTGLVKRERKIARVVMFWVLVLSFGVRLQRTLASLKRSYEKRKGRSLSDGSWYERFSPELVAFLKACVLRGSLPIGAEHYPLGLPESTGYPNTPKPVREIHGDALGVPDPAVDASAGVLNAADLDALVVDFDGVLTDNFVYVNESGHESVRCCRADGLGFDALRTTHLKVFILSTERNPVVLARGAKAWRPRSFRAAR